jgi:branched-chain amino acid transport system permease protein
LGVLLGAPTLKLRGDYLAIVTLGFGEIIRVFLNNLDHPVNITNGPKGMGQIDSVSILRAGLRASR